MITDACGLVPNPNQEPSWLGRNNRQFIVLEQGPTKVAYGIRVVVFGYDSPTIIHIRPMHGLDHVASDKGSVRSLKKSHPHVLHPIPTQSSPRRPLGHLRRRAQG